MKSKMAVVFWTPGRAVACTVSYVGAGRGSWCDADVKGPRSSRWVFSSSLYSASKVAASRQTWRYEGCTEHSVLGMYHRMYHGCIRDVLGMYWGCTGDVLGMYWGCTGGVLGMYWGCTGDVLGMYWGCAGDVLGMYWGCTGDVLGMY